MRTRSIILALLSIALFQAGQAQIKVFPGGKQSYGTLNSPQGNTSHLFNGNIRLANWTDVIFDCSGPYSSPIIYPSSDWYLHLGTSTKKIGDIYVNHIITTMAVTVTSDKRLKQNINYELNTFEKLRKIRPASYNLSTEMFNGAPRQVIDKFSKVKTYGVIAQEVMEIFPELVEIDSVTGKYGVKYNDFIPMLIDAFKTQQIQIEKQQNMIRDLQIQLNNLSNTSTGIQDNLTTSNSSNTTFLGQNKPNPFNKESSIEFSLPENVSKAELLIFDLNGKLIKTISVAQRGKGNITMNANILTAGMYLYTLMADL